MRWWMGIFHLTVTRKEQLEILDRGCSLTDWTTEFRHVLFTIECATLWRQYVGAQLALRMSVSLDSEAITYRIYFAKYIKSRMTSISYLCGIKPHKMWNMGGCAGLLLVSLGEQCCPPCSPQNQKLKILVFFFNPNDLKVKILFL